jgi:hypothetical protein
MGDVAVLTHPVNFRAPDEEETGIWCYDVILL